ncbi:alpha/beta hydrolase [Caldimonas brevitalea]|uniref:Alpha/beta hydrolase n=1 Tax=Caldimonas brevitalea TaxID=413882 RepID=A0A0G3BY05_9BURK|nr:alpha/beta hydrolase [Caldimonas brevitalea]AKJ31420.1 alpha/beta hydrolase [Caldimonas brevitalea]
MKFSALLKTLVLIVLVAVAALAAAIVFGGPASPAAMQSINNPFRAVDFSDLPPLQRFRGNDGASLAYRRYRATGSALPGSVVLVHGSSGNSSSMHVLAKGYAGAGYDTYALDMRGHGESGTRGRIDDIGQLEEDLGAFVAAVQPPRPSTLVGFSAGGGFVLRFVGGARQDVFQSCLLLSPFLSQDAPTYRPKSGGWVEVGVPRVVALSVLNQIGLKAFNHLPVAQFAVSEEAKRFLTPQYSFALAANFRPHRDYAADIRGVKRPCAVLAGADDEVFYTEKLAAEFRAQGQDWPVTLLPGVGHVNLTLDPGAVKAAVTAVQGLQAKGS